MRALWRRWRWWLLSGLALLLVGTMVAGIPGSDSYAPLDPRSGAPGGTRAADQLLQQRGVTSRTATSESELTAALRADDTTVVLSYPDELPYQELARLAALHRGARSRLVLVAPDQPVLNAFSPGISTYYSDADGNTPVEPSCKLPEAVNAGAAQLGGQSYDPGPSDTGCYPHGGTRRSLVSRTTGTQQVVVVGSARPFTNERLDREGNAALALGLFGAHRQLVWQTPGHNVAATATGGHKTIDELIPSGWHWAALQLTFAALLAVVWRARRLGPVLSERLPAVVRASETTEGRARLYHRANARGHAAETLRRATRRRAAAALGLPHTAGDPEPTALTEAAAARLGRPAADLQHLLYGPAPTDDAALLRLADELDDIEWQVRQP
ncbi:DUF4350 domain-containing protein [Kitasatospora cheerisanensis]|uniref:DUF4350 domain-containing protein n=1 Tax=Kitasatospora cheerisanensis KCTC 2395 TaxID=1348663 RepID=A0A066YZ42_9ACTN|nr:DUF4350 domain-containing protein [Kitasatospora cheerisanensis]KDN85244.1 hypothetical protein KCH_30630 [Kitasatospora cheerisanensis KCTC 2395]